MSGKGTNNIETIFDGNLYNSRIMKLLRNETVNVKLNSEYDAIIPSDNCVDIDANTLSQSLAKYSLLKYRFVCIHCEIIDCY